MTKVTPLVAECKEFGEKTDKHDIHGYHTYWQVIDDREYFFAVPTEAKAQEDLETLSENAGIPFAFRKTMLKHMNTNFYTRSITQEMMVVQDYVSRFAQYAKTGYSLYLWSHFCGSGKTMLSSAIGNEILSSGYSVCFTTTEAMYSKIQDTYSDRSEHSEKYVTDHFKDCDLLILDDFGSEKVTEWVDSKLFEIINARIENKKPVVYTSNLAPKELEYNKRTIDRVENSCEELHWPEDGVRKSVGYMKKKHREQEWQHMNLLGEEKAE